MSNIKKILVDSNVWLDCYVATRINSEASLEFIELASKQGLDLLYPIHILKDVFYIMQAELKAAAHKQDTLSDTAYAAISESAWGCINNIRNLATAIAADESDAWLACKYRSFNADLEDNFVLAAAERAQVDLLVTNDEGLLRKATVAACSSHDALKLLETQA